MRAQKRFTGRLLSTVTKYADQRWSQSVIHITFHPNDGYAAPGAAASLPLLDNLKDHALVGCAAHHGRSKQIPVAVHDHAREGHISIGGS